MTDTKPCKCGKLMILVETGVVLTTYPAQHERRWWCGGCGAASAAEPRRGITIEQSNRELWEYAREHAQRQAMVTNLPVCPKCGRFIGSHAALPECLCGLDNINAHGQPERYNIHAIIRPHCQTGEPPKIGKGTWIGPFTMIDGTGGLTIGEGCDIAAGAQIYSHSTVDRCITNREYQTIDYSETIIGDNVFVGAGAIILRGTHIGNRCVVAAGAVVLEHSRVSDDTMMAGGRGFASKVRFSKR